MRSGSCTVRVYQNKTARAKLFVCFLLGWAGGGARVPALAELLIQYVWQSQQSMDQPGKVANPARGQLNRKNEYSPVPVRA